MQNIENWLIENPNHEFTVRILNNHKKGSKFTSQCTLFGSGTNHATGTGYGETIEECVSDGFEECVKYDPERLKCVKYNPETLKT